MMKEKKIFQPLSSNNVFQIYESLLKYELIAFPLTAEAKSKVESLVSTITGNYFGKEIYETTEEKVVAYLYFLIKDHPFTDGNKRTATLSFAILCDLNHLTVYPEYILDSLAIYIEKIKTIDHHSVIKTLSDLLFAPNQTTQ